MGNGSVIRPGDVQRMSAGTGVTHSEYNHSGSEPVHFLQIWVLPNAKGHQPGYEQTFFSDDEKRGRLRLVASETGREGSVSLNQDADVHAGLFDGAETAIFHVRPNRDLWLHIARGSVTVNTQVLDAGDGAAVSGPGELNFSKAIRPKYCCSTWRWHHEVVRPHDHVDEADELGYRLLWQGEPEDM